MSEDIVQHCERPAGQCEVTVNVAELPLPAGSSAEGQHNRYTASYEAQTTDVSTTAMLITLNFFPDLEDNKAQTGKRLGNKNDTDGQRVGKLVTNQCRVRHRCVNTRPPQMARHDRAKAAAKDPWNTRTFIYTLNIISYDHMHVIGQAVKHLARYLTASEKTQGFWTGGHNAELGVGPTTKRSVVTTPRPPHMAMTKQQHAIYFIHDQTFLSRRFGPVAPICRCKSDQYRASNYRSS
jgi:hypothetical protein